MPAGPFFRPKALIILRRSIAIGADRHKGADPISVIKVNKMETLIKG
jgi:hypothetical protein